MRRVLLVCFLVLMGCDPVRVPDDGAAPESDASAWWSEPAVCDAFGVPACPLGLTPRCILTVAGEPQEETWSPPAGESCSGVEPGDPVPCPGGHVPRCR